MVNFRKTFSIVINIRKLYKLQNDHIISGNTCVTLVTSLSNRLKSDENSQSHCFYLRFYVSNILTFYGSAFYFISFYFYKNFLQIIFGHENKILFFIFKSIGIYIILENKLMDKTIVFICDIIDYLRGTRYYYLNLQRFSSTMFYITSHKSFCFSVLKVLQYFDRKKVGRVILVIMICIFL